MSPRLTTSAAGSGGRETTMARPPRHPKPVTAAVTALKNAPIVSLGVGNHRVVSGRPRPGRRYALIPAPLAASLVERLGGTDGRTRLDPSKRKRRTKRQPTARARTRVSH